eukprot:10179680-Ditylum_brightwellii.AAC.1
MKQQMKQRKDNKATKEQQLLIACMKCKSNGRAREEQEVQQEPRHQDFMMMMMVTSAKPPVPVPTSTLFSN